jgi:membrane-associated protease RseP (regulator of RpoE activity)
MVWLGGAVLLAVIAAVLVMRGSNPTRAGWHSQGSKSETEFGALEKLPIDRGARALEEPVEGPDSGPADSLSYEERMAEIEPYRITNRPTRAFDAERLALNGYDAERIEEIHRSYLDYAKTVRDAHHGELAPNFLRVSFRDREERRKERERFLSDEDYDAALYATSQPNRAIFVAPKPGSPAVEAGLRKGDELLVLNGRRIFETTDFTDARDSLHDGEMHHLVILRGDREMTLSIECCRPGWGGVTTIATLPHRRADD